MLSCARGLIVLIVLAVLPTAGCRSGTPQPKDTRPVEIRQTTDYVYDRMGFQVDPATGQQLDTAYNRQLEIQIGR